MWPRYFQFSASGLYFPYPCDCRGQNNVWTEPLQSLEPRPQEASLIPHLEPKSSHKWTNVGCFAGRWETCWGKLNLPDAEKRQDFQLQWAKPNSDQNCPARHSPNCQSLFPKHRKRKGVDEIDSGLRIVKVAGGRASHCKSKVRITVKISLYSWLRVCSEQKGKWS